MTDLPAQEFILGTGEARADFAHLNQNFQLKLRAFVDICMPAAFAEMEQHLSVFSLRQRGIATIMFFLEFESSPARIAFGRPIFTKHKTGLLRHETEDGQRRRLLMDFFSELHAYESQGEGGGLGFEPEKGALVPVGRAKILQMITRPLAPQGERDVAEPPEEMAMLKVRPWEGEFPSLAMVGAPPQGYQEMDTGKWGEYFSVWGLPNTDINHHVNVVEYISGFENQFTRQVFAAGLPVPAHRMSAAKLLFRKPFFPGESYGVQGRLFVKDNATVFLGSYHRMGPEGQPEQQPHVVARFEGVIDSPG